MKDEITRREKWTIRGHIDLTCARCQHVGATLLMETEVEARMLVTGSDTPGEEDFVLGLRTVECEVPIILRCAACGNTVKFGRNAALTAREVTDGVPDSHAA